MADSWEQRDDEEVIYQPVPPKPSLNPSAGSFSFNPTAGNFTPGGGFTPAAASAPTAATRAPAAPAPVQPSPPSTAPPAPSNPAPTDSSNGAPPARKEAAVAQPKAGPAAKGMYLP